MSYDQEHTPFRLEDLTHPNDNNNNSNHDNYG